MSMMMMIIMMMMMMMMQASGDSVTCWLVNNYSLLTIYRFAQYTIPKAMAVHVILRAYARGDNKKHVSM
jgi:hypothetical protein